MKSTTYSFCNMKNVCEKFIVDEKKIAKIYYTQTSYSLEVCCKGSVYSTYRKTSVVDYPTVLKAID